mmetsp:Transcript_12454/g.33992  ORF Transcript_12454/g.33992 Transcript_12454/m.33992 type:complete len:301 (+) Transcript_12454:132-1034(+)
MQLSQFSQTTCLLHGGPRHLPSPLPRRPGLLGRSSLCCNKHVAQGYREEGSASLGPEGVPFAKDGAAAKRPSPDKPVGKDTKKGKLQGLLPTASGRHLLLHAGRLLKDHFWPIVIIYAAKDSLSFVLHRLSQRLTNAAAEGLFGTSIPAAANPWWLYLESNFLESNVGYQACIVAFFLLALPLNILLSSLAASNTAIVCSPELTGMQGGSPSTRSSSGGGSSSLAVLVTQISSPAAAAASLAHQTAALMAQPRPLLQLLLQVVHVKQQLLHTLHTAAGTHAAVAAAASVGLTLVLLLPNP